MHVSRPSTANAADCMADEEKERAELQSQEDPKAAMVGVSLAPMSQLRLHPEVPA